VTISFLVPTLVQFSAALRLLSYLVSVFSIPDLVSMPIERNARLVFLVFGVDQSLAYWLKWCGANLGSWWEGYTCLFSQSPGGNSTGALLMF
jgi:hypothetical protein